jgi:hypothetical protein
VDHSVFGRVLGTAVGVFYVLLPFDVGDGGTAWSGSAGVVVGDAVLTLVGVIVMIAFWTSRLVVADGVVTATNFFVSRSMPLEDVAVVDPSAVPFLGMKIRRADGSGMRTLVCGRSWDELWTPRAARIGQEIVRLAKEVRGELVGHGGHRAASPSRRGIASVFRSARHRRSPSKHPSSG